GSRVSPPTNSSVVSSQSTRPSFRAMKPSRLAAMWIVTRESRFAIVERLLSRPTVTQLFQHQVSLRLACNSQRYSASETALDLRHGYQLAPQANAQEVAFVLCRPGLEALTRLRGQGHP